MRNTNDFDKQSANKDCAYCYNHTTVITSLLRYMDKVKLFYPKGIESIWHYSTDKKRKYRLDGIEKLVRLKGDLQQDANFELIEVKDASIDLLRTVHSTEYVNALVSGEPKELAESSGLIWQSGLAQAFANCAQALILAAKEAMSSNSRTGVIAKGGHHAVSCRGFGFNPVNEIAICVSTLQAESPDTKIAVIDLDIHFANGLHELLANKPNTLLLDIWTKTQEKWGDATSARNLISFKAESKQSYLETLDRVIEEATSFQPDVVLYHSGMDVYERDRLGGIPGFDVEAISERESRIMRAFPQKLVLVLGGGYVDHSDPDLSEAKMAELVNLHRVSYKLLFLNPASL